MFANVCNGFWKSRECQDQNKLRVYVNVYDMLEPSVLTNIGDAIGFGIYHSGVEVGGHEYCFGGHEYERLTGVFSVVPKIGPPGVLFKQSLPVGFTDHSEAEVAQILRDISRDYGGTSYNLLTRNCNHFSYDLCKRLTGKTPPGWVNRAAKLGTMFPCVIPDEWIEPPEFESGSSTAVQSPISIDGNGRPHKKTEPTAKRHISSSASSSSSLPPPFPLPLPPTPTHAAKPRPLSHQSCDTHLAHRRRSSVPPSSSRRPSGSDHDSVVLPRPSSPIANDDYDPVKEPDCIRPEVIRSATQLSISASLQEMDHPLARSPGPASPVL